MTMNEQKGNMYGWITHTWNAVKGKCLHDCSYCYMKRWKQNPIRLDVKEFKTDLGENNFIFVGSSTDMFANDVPSEWIIKTLEHCNKYPKNTYLFQTKNPMRFKEFRELYPFGSILGTTIETNRDEDFKSCPNISSRVSFMEQKWIGRKMVTIEPIMNFDVTLLVEFMERINPEFINIGADSGNNNLEEPSRFKIESLIKNLKNFTKVNLKDNLKRLYAVSLEGEGQ